MKYIPLLIVCFLLVGSCKPKKEISSVEQRKRLQEYRTKQNTEKSIAGFWKEYRRTVGKNSKDEKDLTFTDTLRVVFREDSTTRFYDLQGRISGGHLTRKNGLYHLGNGQRFTTIERTGDVLQLSHKGQTAYLKKVTGFYTSPITKEKNNKEDESKNERVDERFLQGEWKVYKKEDPNFSNSNVYLHSFKINSSIGNRSYNIKVNHNLATRLNSSTGILRVFEKEVKFETPYYNKTFKVQKAQGAEMVLKDGAIVYYLKNLTK